MPFIRPPTGKVLLVDVPESAVGGIALPGGDGERLDKYVAAVGGQVGEIGVGDIVIIGDPNAGKRTKIDGVQYLLTDYENVKAVLG